MKNKNDYNNSDRRRETEHFAIKAIVYCAAIILLLGLISIMIR